MKNISYVIILVLIVIILLQRMCTTNVDCPECVEFDTTEFIATLPIKYKDTTVYVPQPYPVHHYNDTGSVVEVVIPADIDSLEIATAYFSEWMLVDTILNDTNGLIVINDRISQNKIQERFIYPKIITPHFKIVAKTKPYKERIKVFAGVGVNGNMNKFGISASILINTKKDALYSIYYDVINKDIGLTMYWKLKFKK